jgi:hypothetical protein
MKRARGDAKADSKRLPRDDERRDSCRKAAVSSELAESSSVLRVITVPKAAASVELTPDNVFQQFVAPMSVDEFLSTIYRKKCLAIQGGGTARLRTVVDEGLYGGDLGALMDNTASDNLFCWLKGTDGSIGSIQLESSSAAMTCYSAGASLYFRSPQAFADQYVTAMARGVKMSFGSFYSNGMLVWLALWASGCGSLCVLR